MIIIISHILLVISAILWFYCYNTIKYKDVLLFKSDKVLISNKYLLMLHKLSYYAPFVWFNFGDSKKDSEEQKKLEIKLMHANVTKYFSARSYQCLKTVILIISIVFGIIIYDLISTNTLEWILNVKNSSVYSDNISVTQLAYMICFLASPSILMNLYLEYKIKTYKLTRLKEVPLIILIMVVMLRVKKSTKDILINIGKLNTTYRHIFEKGARIYIANKSEGINFIHSNIEDVRFKAAIDVLRDAEEFRIETLVNSLDNLMRDIVDMNDSILRRSDITKAVLSQGTIGIPFIAVLLLGIVPLGVYGIELLQSIM